MRTIEQLERERTLLASRVTMDEGFLRAFAAVSDAVVRSFPLEKVLDIALEAALQNPRVQAGEIYVVEEERGELTYACHRGLSEECVQEAKEVPVRLGEGITGRVAALEEPIFVLELSEDGRFLRRVPTKEGYCSLFSLPIESAGRLWGVMNLFSRESRRLSPRYLDWLAALGQLLGIAFEHARLLEGTEARAKGVRESEEKYRDLIEGINDGYAVVRKDRIIFANSRFAQIAGYPLDQLVGESFVKLLAPEVLEESWQAYERSMRGEPALGRYESVILREDGARVPIEVSLKDIIYEGKPAVSTIIRDITERKRAEEALRESQERLRRMFESVNEGIAVTDLNGVIVEVNERGVELYGAGSRDEVLGKSAFEFIAHRDHERARANMGKTLEQGLVRGIEYSFVKADGSEYPGELSASVLEDASGNPVGFIAIIRDISERKRAEEALGASEEKYRELFETTLDGMAVIDAETMTIVLANQAAVKMYGFDSVEDIVGVNPLDFIPVEDRERVLKIMAKDMFESDLRQINEFRTFTKDGREIWLSAVGVRTEYQGKLAGLVSFRDITERKRAEAELRESEEEYRHLVEDINDGYIVLRGGRIVFANQRCAEVMGIPLDHISRQPFWKFLAPESLEVAIQLYERSMRGESLTGEVHEFTILREDGTRIPVEISYKDIIYEGKPAVSHILRDISERKRAEEALKASEEKYRHLFESALEGVFVIDAETMKVVLANQAVAKMYGFDSVEDAIGINPLDFVPPEDREGVLTIIVKDMFESDLRQVNEFRTITKDGREIWIAAVGTRTEYQGRLAGLISIRDITERRRAEDERASLYQEITEKAERLAVTAELTRIITSSLNIKDVYEAFAAGVKKLVGFDRASIALVESDRLRFIAVFSEVETELGTGATIPLKDSVTAWVMAHKRTNIETDFARERQFPIDERHLRSGLRSAIRVPLFSKGEVFGTFNLSSRHPNAYGEREQEILEELAGQIAVAIENARLYEEAKRRKEDLESAYEQLMGSTRALERSKQELEDAYLKMARTLVLTLEARDPYTRGHSERVAQLARQIAFEMGLSQEEMRNMETAARLHDLGKIGIPDGILLKPGPITPSERAEIQLHPTRAVDLLRFLGFLNGTLPIIEHHHEHYNGGGYPNSLRGEQTPLGARILAVADAYDAMTSARPYRPPMTSEEAIRILKEGAGTQWDPKVVEAFVRAFGNKD